MAAVEDLVLWRSEQTPGRLALKSGRTAWTFADLHRQVRVAAGALRSLGVKRGDRVCLLLTPSETFVAAVHAISRLGAIAVPINVRQSPGEILWQLEDCGPRLVLFDRAHAGIREALKGTAARWADSQLLGDCDEPVGEGPGEPRGTHTIIYTSGTSGSPKGVEITQSNLVWNAVSFAGSNGVLPDDRWLLVLPLYHVGGYAVLFRSLVNGVGVVIKPRFVAADALEALREERVTLLSVVPTMLREMMMAGRGRLSSTLRLVFLGGSPPPESLLERARTRGLPVVVTYGMTETCSQVALSPILGKKGPKVYREMFPTSVRVSAKRGKVGEIVVDGPTVATGYWRNAKATRAAFKDDGFHTGDLGYLRADGGLVVVGRAEDTIMSGGEKIYPGEVESRLIEHPAVRDALVLGVEDERWGQRAEAVLVLKRGRKAPDEAELKAFLAQRIGRYKIPKAFHYWESLPATSTGKTKRQAIRTELEERAR